MQGMTIRHSGVQHTLLIWCVLLIRLQCDTRSFLHRLSAHLPAAAHYPCQRLRLKGLRYSSNHLRVAFQVTIASCLFLKLNTCPALGMMMT